MKYAADFRAIARDALRGKWSIAILAGFIAYFLGAGIATGGGGSSISRNSNSSNSLFQDIHAAENWFLIRNILFTVIAVLLIWVIITFVISGAVRLGYAVFNLKLVDRKEVSISDLFSQFHRFGDGFCMNILIDLYVFLWSLLLVVPGIVKAYSYAMTPYILAENPRMSANEAITESRRVMNGNKFRLFCLGISFIGWELLCAIPAVIGTVYVSGMVIMGADLATLLWIIPSVFLSMIGSLFINPYREAAYAAFYRDIAGSPVKEFEEKEAKTEFF